MELKEKSLTELRSMASNLGIADVFNKRKDALISLIKAKQETQEPEVKPEFNVAEIVIDEKIVVIEKRIESALSPFIAKGLRITFPYPDAWQMNLAGKVDTGNLNMPIIDILRCAERLFR